MAFKKKEQDEEENEETNGKKELKVTSIPKAEDEETKAPESKKIVSSESDAVKLFNADYTLPAGNTVAYVCEDGNVFFESGVNSGLAHAKEKKLKLYTIKP